MSKILPQAQSAGLAARPTATRSNIGRSPPEPAATQPAAGHRPFEQERGQRSSAVAQALHSCQTDLTLTNARPVNTANRTTTVSTTPNILYSRVTAVGLVI